MTTRRDNRASARLAQFVGLATLIHFAVLPLLGGLVPDAPERHSKPIKLVSLSGKTMRRLQQQKLAAKKQLEKEEAKKKKEDKPEDLRGQVVDIPPSPDNTAPDEYEYLSEHNTRTERETKSRHQTQDYANAMNELTRSKSQEATSPKKDSQSTAIELGPEEPKDERDQKVAGRQQVFELPNIRQRDRLALKVDPEVGAIANQNYSEALRGQSNRLRLDVGDPAQQPRETGTAPNAGQPAVDLVPTLGVLAQIAGAPANDHLSDLEEGEGTFLNSREFKYASFFNRMKQGVSQQWRPLVEYRRRDPSGNVYGQRSRVTVLKVVLTREGGLKDIEVTHSSGVDFLDNEAIAAFRRAQPFPNPPQGLIDDSTGDIDFPFGFHIEFSRSGLQLPF